MRLLGAFLALITITTAPSVIESDAGLDTEVFIREEGLRGFFLTVADYYRIPQREVIMIRERGIPPYEIPVALFIAKRAHVPPEVITDLRLGENNWLDITLRLGLSPEIFYVPVGVVVTVPPYGKVYGYYKNKPKKTGKTIPINDNDIINLLNLKFMSEHYGYPPEKIIKMRSEGKEFVSINDKIRKEGQAKAWGSRVLNSKGE